MFVFTYMYFIKRFYNKKLSIAQYFYLFTYFWLELTNIQFIYKTKVYKILAFNNISISRTQNNIKMTRTSVIEINCIFCWFPIIQIAPPLTFVPSVHVFAKHFGCHQYLSFCGPCTRFLHFCGLQITFPFT